MKKDWTKYQQVSAKYRKVMPSVSEKEKFFSVVFHNPKAVLKIAKSIFRRFVEEVKVEYHRLPKTQNSIIELSHGDFLQFKKETREL